MNGIPFAIEDDIDLAHVKTSRGEAAKQGVFDRDSRGKSKFNETQILLSKKALKKDTRYQKDKKRKQCKRQAAIEPIIGHLKSDFRLAKNGSSGKCVLSGSTDQNIFSFMQRHNFQFEEFNIPETISHFVQRFDLVIRTFQWSG